MDAIQALYGRYTGGGSSTPTTTKSPPSNPATESPAGGMVYVGDRKWYISLFCKASSLREIGQNIAKASSRSRKIFTHFSDGDNTDLCRDGRVDTVFSTGDGSYYVFKGSKYWKLTDDSVDSGYPRNIASDWPGTIRFIRDKAMSN